ncbi:cysteine peptidase family C39 domain-containing protein [Mucilaginibacter angelicae]|uniref:Cysteine peptidase family C39 domain-containing protein n=1 Tax=Mucilaginibacter angelicae TaxID=869718 RepID=A0ABV6L0G2_9SPHI
MKNIYTIYNTFVGQAGQNDCGIACLSMLLNYGGRYDDADKLISDYSASEDGFSLLELRNLAGNLQLPSRCVTMDLSSIRGVKTPCILHTINHKGEGHFVVCFGAEKKSANYRYLIGDPATQVHFIPEMELLKTWPGSAALYFDPIKLSLYGITGHPWFGLLRIKAFRKALLISVPFLNICSTILGIALSWLLQRGMNDSLADKKNSLVIAVVLLLLFMMLFKSLLSYVRQHILITLNGAVREYFTGGFIRKILSAEFMPGINEHIIKKGFADIQKIQNALSAFIMVMMSEGCIISLIAAALWYFDPAVGFINTAYLILVTFLAIRTSPELSYQHAALNEMSVSGENALLSAAFNLPDIQRQADTLQSHLQNQTRYLKRAKALAIAVSRLNLWYEWLGTVNVIAVFIFCLYHIRHLAISYNTLMAEVILSYFITALMPKVCNVFSVISEGSRLARRYLNI